MKIPSALFLCGAVWAGMAGLLPAETCSFPEHNFAIEIPEGWTKTDAPAPAVAAAKNADGQKIFVIIAARIPENERDTAVQSMSSAAKKASEARGWKIGSDRKVEVKGIAFDTYTSQVPGGITVTSWMTSAGSEVYSLECIHKAGDPSNDPEFKSMIESFRLLSPAPANKSAYDTNSVAYRVGRLVGGACACVFLLGLLVLAGLGVAWLIRRKKSSG